jgi:hypothetical protein
MLPLEVIVEVILFFTLLLALAAAVEDSIKQVEDFLEALVVEPLASTLVLFHQVTELLIKGFLEELVLEISHLPMAVEAVVVLELQEETALLQQVALEELV